MTKALSTTDWPSIDIPMENRKLTGRFFELVDQPEKDSGRRLADEVFTEDGEMIAAGGPFFGSNAIAKSREQAWDVIKSRRHEVVKVYASNPEGLDLLLIGKLTAGLGSGKEAMVGFVARIIMQGTVKGLRMKRYEVWSDQTPIKNLLQQS